MPDYHAAFLTGEVLRVADADTLRLFQQEWTYHHPLQEQQLAYAGQLCSVRSVSFYHGGDCLYQLCRWVLDAPFSPETPYPSSHEENMPGYWHEACLRERDMTRLGIPLPMASEVYTIIAESRSKQPVVVVRTVEGVECLIMRHLQNEREAALMSQVAEIRNIYAFEKRYNFQGVAHDAMIHQAQEKQRKQEAKYEK